MRTTFRKLKTKQYVSLFEFSVAFANVFVVAGKLVRVFDFGELLVFMCLLMRCCDNICLYMELAVG